MVFLFIQKPLYLSSFPGSTDAKCGVQSIKPLLQRPDCPDPFHRIVGQYSYVLIRTGTAFSFKNVEQLFFHRGLRSQPPIVSFSKLNIFSVDVCV